MFVEKNVCRFPPGVPTKCPRIKSVIERFFDEKVPVGTGGSVGLLVGLVDFWLVSVLELGSHWSFKLNFCHPNK